MSILESEELRAWIEQTLPNLLTGRFIEALAHELGLTDDQRDIHLNEIFGDFQQTGDCQRDTQELLALLKSHMALCSVTPMFVGNTEKDQAGLESLTYELLERYRLAHKLLVDMSRSRWERSLGKRTLDDPSDKGHWPTV